MDHLHWQMLLQSHRQIHATALLALATLGGETQVGSFLFFVTPSQVAKPSTSVSLSHVIVTGIIALTFANVNIAFYTSRESLFSHSDAVSTLKFISYQITIVRNSHNNLQFNPLCKCDFKRF